MNEERLLERSLFVYNMNGAQAAMPASFNNSQGMVSSEGKKRGFKKAAEKN